MVCWLLIAVASLDAENRLQGTWPQWLRHTGSVAVAPRHHSTGSRLVAHGLELPATCGIFPDQGSESMSPALTGRVSSTVPPAKSCDEIF